MNVTELRELVAGYTPSGPDEEGFHRRLSQLVAVVDDPWTRHRFDPGHVTASAFVLDPERAAVALVLHGKLGRWVQPGGHVEAEDVSHEHAARREVAEEILVDDVASLGLIDLDIHRFPERSGDPAHLHFDLRWAFVAHRRHLGIGDGTSDVRWVPLDEVERMEEAGMVRAARKLRELR